MNPLAETFGFAVGIVHPRLDVPRVVVHTDEVRSDGVEQPDVVVGRDPIFERDHHARLFRVARHLFHHGDERVDLWLILHVDMAVAEDREQDIVRSDVSRHLDGFDQQDGGGRIRMKRQPQLARGTDRQRTDLNPVLERSLFEFRLRLGIPKVRTAVSRKRQAHLDPVEADLACQGDLGHVASLAKVPVGHPDSDRQRVCIHRGRPRPEPVEGRDGQRRRNCGPLHKIPSGHHHRCLPIVEIIRRSRRCRPNNLRYVGVCIHKVNGESD